MAMNSTLLKVMIMPRNNTHSVVCSHTVGWVTGKASGI